MIFEEELFEMSSKANNMVESSETCEDENVLKQQNELLKELFKKFREELQRLKQTEGIKNGILKVYFVDHWRCAHEKGFGLISHLVENGNFDSFAREYCIYLGAVKERTQPFTNQYYEVIWDYKTYYEHLRMRQDSNKKVNVQEIKEELTSLTR